MTEVLYFGKRKLKFLRTPCEIEFRRKLAKITHGESTKSIWHSAIDCILWAQFLSVISRELQDIGTRTNKVTSSSSWDGDILRVDWRYAEGHTSHERKKSFFTPEDNVALAFLKMYAGLTAPKLREDLNGNIHNQILCGIRICPENQLTNYKLIDSVMLELSKRLKIQEQLNLLWECFERI